MDLEAVEGATRSAVHRAGAALLAHFRSRNLFVGSGVIEAACRTVIAKCLKQSAMFWTVRGANAIIALRCTRLSREFEDYLASRSKAA